MGGNTGNRRGDHRSAAIPGLDERDPGVRWPLWEQMDQVRRWSGGLLETLGLGPIETPSRTVFGEPAVTLKAYGDADVGRPTLLLVPAPIKRAYIWDLAPWASVVRQCLRRGVGVYLVQWEPPGADEQGFGLAEYADRLILDCLRAIEAESGRRSVFLAGHSLGGTLAAIFAALHPERVGGLVLLGAPLRFGPEVGALGPLVAVAPPIQSVTSQLGNVPGSVLDAVSGLAAPVTFQWSRWMDWMASLPDHQARFTHLLVERWTLDEMRMARRLFEEVVELLYREDRLTRGTLKVGERRVAPEQVVAPLLSVIARNCAVAPPEAVLPFHEAAGSREKRHLWYGGDTGVALRHVGMLVGRSAHRRLWPEIIDWIHAHA